tara:strand:+ start:3759 stop:4538 length:780 start_codon:yes stop_codon:yes gene_type:complete
MKPIITQVLPVYPKHIYVQWTVEDKESALGSVDILRSQSASGPYNVIASLTSSDYSYQDIEPNLLGLSRAYYYIVKANSVYSGSEYVLSEPRTAEYELKGHRAKIARKARRDLKIQLERLNGVPIVILKRRSFGPRCTECYNEVTNDVMFSHCNTCYGTTYLEGYHDPVYTYGKLDPVVVQESVGSSGLNESAMTGLTITEYPVVETNDIVIEARTNRRFKVMRKVSSESSRVLVHQDLQVSEISRAGIEYEIPVRLIE